MAYWLVKSEPSSWSWGDQVKKGVEHWNGVRNHQADNNMKAMKKGDKVFFYHSINEKQIVGVTQVTREHYPDPSDESGRFGMVDLKALFSLKTPVTLKQIKGDKRLQELALIRQSRLSVMAIDVSSWRIICALGGINS
jgi:predicted RNA-binding protein with PUA-like domain